ncbi:hypothetical protein DND132_0968 [Pseudodesulfovibrio mercurii]|uniref:Uncharacterized protein n=1 Tax=Pseudodesulfovibrio mercurii TaxID=641491 RepID=F0JIC9_9BACT|nr:DsrE family protein [Pseudodesulfovibrio mercurii]EGB14181.1 hypothetical protein DND132_0968 [Pseudodesulfovibrio mercurii]
MINSLVLFVNKPLGVELSALGVRTAWACHENSFDVKLIFLGDGVWCATDKRGYHAEMIKRLIENDGEVFCVEESLKEQGIDPDSLIEGIDVVPREEICDFCEDVESVVSF